MLVKSSSFFIVIFSLVTYFLTTTLSSSGSPLFFSLAQETINNDSDNYELVWSDEFSGTEFNLSRYDLELGFIRNHESQYYTNRSSNLYLTGNGTCIIKARNDLPVYEDGTNKIISNITSASFYTKETFTYGKFVASLKVPTGKNGSWPAFWLLGIPANSPFGWPAEGELDIMENVGYQPNILHGTIHDEQNNGWRGNQLGNTTPIENMGERFAEYGIEWTPTFVRFFYRNLNVNESASSADEINDEVTYFRFDNDGKCEDKSWPYYKQFQMKLNFAIGGSWGGLHGIAPDLLPAEYEIDYIRVYRKSSFPAPNQRTCKKYFYSIAFDVSYDDDKKSSLSYQDARDLIFLNPKITSDLTIALNIGVFRDMFTQDSVKNKKIYVNAISADMASSNAEKKTIRIFVDFSIVDFEEAAFDKVKDDALKLLKTKDIYGFAEIAFSYNPSTFFMKILPETFVLADNNNNTHIQNQNQDNQEVFDDKQQQHKNPSPFPFDNFSVPVNISATGYDFGGSGIAYLDTTVWNQNDNNKANVQRAGLDGVDINVFKKDENNEFIVGYIVDGEWLKYSCVYFAENATSKKAITTRVSFDYAFSGGDANGQAVITFADANTKRNIPVSNFKSTGDWNTFATTEPVEFTLDKPGQYSMTLSFESSLVLKTIHFDSEYHHPPSSNNNNNHNHNDGDKLSDRDKDIIIGACVGTFIALVGAFVFIRHRRMEREGNSGEGNPILSMDGKNTNNNYESSSYSKNEV